jgi:nucleotide-binding universal stress UspA family protein
MAGTAEGILVGYDGSAGSEEALRWAAREANARGVVLWGLPGAAAARNHRSTSGKYVADARRDDRSRDGRPPSLLRRTAA